jgi:methionine sulfoxide reductase catalytic subunit
MLIKKPQPFKESEITDQEIYLQRRRFMKTSGRAGMAAGLLATAPSLWYPGAAKAGTPLEGVVKSPLSTSEEQTSFEYASQYNNFYEFGTDKEDPAHNAGSLRTRPWSIKVSGECEKAGVYDIDDFINPHTLEERIYRLRCVEAWSMVIPWVGIPLGPVLKRFKPTSKARYVAFETLYDPEQMPGQKRRVLDWPYVEGLRIDEAMHPLALFAVGMYGQVLPNQNGAPIRLVVPWKYGYKSIKSIVSVRFTEKQPPTSWNRSSPGEYGFYSNVNPEVDHPRWSQREERRLTNAEASGFLAMLIPKIDTMMFNGYAEQVAGIYKGMDLRKNY